MENTLLRLLEPGIYKFDISDENQKSRLHLRVDEDLSGLLVVNASKIIYLNPTAMLMAYLYLNKIERAEAIELLLDKFDVPTTDLETDYDATVAKIEALVDENSHACPVCDLGLATNMPFSAKLSAPYRMDLAITYRCNNDCAHCYNARARNYPELSTAEWKAIIDKLWEIGIPHVVFTGGEPTLRDDLPELVAYADQKGMVTGINTNGIRLADQALLDRLVNAGLDHVQITLESHDAQIHDQMVRRSGAWEKTVAGIRNVVKSKLYMMTNTTLLNNNAGQLRETLEFLASEGVPTVGLNALIYSGKGKTIDTGLKEVELPGLLSLAIEMTNQSHQRLIWYTPTQYCHFDPLMLDLGIKGCTAAYYNMCVEPDGSVIPCQSYYQAVGNILSDQWSQIWNHPLCLSLRNRRDIPAECTYCDFLQECGGGCPLARDQQSPEPIYRDLLIRGR
ncbi:MAG: radical SAM protein [Anaerolineaceae bacterium]|jgi:radical SAM protein with 4Fe4S-binding SPASM domain|nr:radical SAM protein [Anaerolineaceae bacterium]MDD4042079.1 radical SAM protein [Anaerolineaceae bacterium]MDD4578096.1 radical SAM protein [Anaerolineaceae bacterium]